MALTVAQAWLQYVTSRSAARVIVTFGDSYVSGAGGVAFGDYIRTTSGAIIINVAAGGATITDELAQIQSVPWLRGRRYFLWDGSANSYGTPAAHLAVVDQILAYVGAGQLAAFAPLAIGPPSGTSAAFLSDMQAIYAGYQSRGILTFDVQAFVVGLNNVADATSTAAGLVGPASTQDGVHLIQTIMQAVVDKANTDILVANGW